MKKVVIGLLIISVLLLIWGIYSVMDGRVYVGIFLIIINTLSVKINIDTLANM